MKISQALILITIQSICYCAKLPPRFKKCDVRKEDFNKCLGKAINDAVRQLYKPLHHYDFPSLGIFNRPEFRMESGDHSENGLKQVYKNITYYGLANPESTNANMDFESNTLKINVTYPEILLDCEYEIHGNVVLLPVDATGTCHVFLIKPTFHFMFELEEYGKDTRYYKVATTKLIVVPENVNIELENIFENQQLNDVFNAELCDKGAAIYEKYERYHGLVTPFFTDLFNKFLNKIPKHELFDGFN